MDFLGNIISGQDLVNKDYVDKAIPVVPTKLSELTDDILSGKYLPLSGGTLTGEVQFDITGLAKSDICTGVIATFKSPRIQATDLICNTITLGASSGSSSDLPLTIRKYSKVTSKNPDGITNLVNIGTDGTVDISSSLRSRNFLRIDTTDYAGNYGYLKPETYVASGNTNRAVLRIGSNYGGNTNMSLGAEALDAINIYRGVVGIGGTFSGDTLYQQQKDGVSLAVSGVETIESTSSNPLKLISPSNTWLMFRNTSDYLGEIGFNYEKIAHCTDASGSAKVIIHSGNYSSYALPLSGGTISSDSYAPLFLDTTNAQCRVQFRVNKVDKALVGYNASYGAWLYNYASSAYLGVKDDGTPHYNGNTLIHSGNIGDYALKKVANVTSLNTNAGEFFYSGFRPAHIPYGNYVGGITLQTFLDAENDYRTQLAFSTDAKGFVRSYTNGSWSYWKTIAFTDSDITGNAGSATKLADNTAFTAWGQTFFENGKPKSLAGTMYFGQNQAALAVPLASGESAKIFLQVNPDGNLLIGQQTAQNSKDTRIYGNTIGFCYGTVGSTSATAMTINSSGNVTIGGSDTAGTDYKLRVDGTSRFTDRVSVTSLRIIPVNGSYSADFAIDGSSLTLNRELKFTNVTASDICSGIAAAFKTSLAQTENLIARNIILGASSGSASNLALNFQKYTSISNTAPNGLTTLMTLTTDGNLGIGTTNPAYRLDVAGSIGCTGGFAAPYFHKSDEFYIGSGALGVSASGALIYTYNNLPIYFFTSGTAAMTIDSGHRVTMEAGLHVKGNFHAGSTWSEDGTSGTTGVTLRNEGGIELTHASTPYIDFHYAAGTTDFSHRLIARTSNIFAYSGNYFCPWGSESLGASSYRWKAVYAKAGNFSNDMEINGALTVGAGATFNGDVVINGNLIVKGDVTSA